MYGWIATGLASLLVLFLWNANGKLHEEIGSLDAKVGALENNLDIAVEDNGITTETLRVCTEVNAVNAKQRDVALLMVEAAEGRIEILAQMLEDIITNDGFEKDFQNEAGCYMVTDPLPFGDSLCVTGSGNCN